MTRVINGLKKGAAFGALHRLEHVLGGEPFVMHVNRDVASTTLLAGWLEAGSSTNWAHRVRVLMD